jgi:hypothetical protein
VADAVARAREVRLGSPGGEVIVVAVAPGTYDETAIPIVIDFDAVEIVGSTVLASDAQRGLPTDDSQHDSVLSTARSAYAFFAIAGAADVKIAGFRFQAGANAFSVSVGDATGFTLSGNAITSSPSGAFDVTSSSGLIAGNYIADCFIGMGIFGGDAAAAPSIRIEGNRILGSHHTQIMLFGAAPIAAAQLHVDVIGNEVVGSHLRPGVRILAFGGARHSVQRSTQVTFKVQHNWINGNAMYGFVIDTFPGFRGGYTADISGELGDNDLTGNGLGQAYFGFALGFSTLLPQTFQYLRDSRISVTSLSRDYGFDYDNPDTPNNADPGGTSEALNNVLLVDGVSYDGIRVGSAP